MTDHVMDRSPHEWCTAWERGMADRGFPRARIEVTLNDAVLVNLEEGEVVTGTAWSYGWTDDLDAALGWIPYDEERHSRGWEAAHEVLVAIDHLRPTAIMASPALQHRLHGGN